MKTSLDLLKGTVDILILKTVSRGPMHGYAISRWIRERTADAFRVEEGALYPALRRLEGKGLLEAEWAITDTNREAKFYQLTAKGRKHLRAEEAGWRRYVAAMSSVLDAPAGGRAR